jgi:hypothetical protein
MLQFPFVSHQFLGDAAYSAHFVRKLAQTRPNDAFVFYSIHEELDSIFSGVSNVAVSHLSNAPENAVECSPTKYYNDLHPKLNCCDEWFLEWFQYLASSVGLQTPFSHFEQLLQDTPALLETNVLTRDFDVLVLNEDSEYPLNNFHISQFTGLVEILSQAGLSIITANPTGVRGVPFYKKHRLGVVEVGHLSVLCRWLVATDCAALPLTFNAWSKETMIQRYLVQDEGSFNYGPKYYTLPTVEALILKIATDLRLPLSTSKM